MVVRYTEVLVLMVKVLLTNKEFLPLRHFLFNGQLIIKVNSAVVTVLIILIFQIEEIFLAQMSHSN